MAGKIRKVGNTYTFVVELPRKPDGGRNHMRRGGFKTKREAEIEQNKILKELYQGSYTQPSVETLAEYLVCWLEDYVKNQNKPSTHSSYEYLLKSHVIPELGNIPLARLQPAQLQQLYSQKLTSGRKDGKGGLSPTTVKRMHVVLNHALKTAVKWRKIPLNPADAVTPPRETREEMKWWTTEQASKFLDNVDNLTYRALYTLALLTGLRRGELLGLRWEDLNLEERYLTVNQSIVRLHNGEMLVQTPKTKQSVRAVPLTELAVSTLKDHRRLQTEHRLALGSGYQNNDLVFASETGTPIHPGNLLRNFKKAIEKANVPAIRFHDLRHSFSSWLIEEGQELVVISRMLGHSSISVTADIYSHITTRTMKEAVDPLDAKLNQTRQNASESQTLKETAQIYLVS